MCTLCVDILEFILLFVISAGWAVLALFTLSTNHFLVAEDFCAIPDTVASLPADLITGVTVSTPLFEGCGVWDLFCWVVEAGAAHDSIDTLAAEVLFAPFQSTGCLHADVWPLPA